MQARFDIAEPTSRTLGMSYEQVLAALGDLTDKPVLYVLLVGGGGRVSENEPTVRVDSVKVNNFEQTAKGFDDRKQ